MSEPQVDKAGFCYVSEASQIQAFYVPLADSVLRLTLLDGALRADRIMRDGDDITGVDMDTTAPLSMGHFISALGLLDKEG